MTDQHNTPEVTADMIVESFDELIAALSRSGPKQPGAPIDFAARADYRRQGHELARRVAATEPDSLPHALVAYLLLTVNHVEADSAAASVHRTTGNTCD